NLPCRTSTKDRTDCQRGAAKRACTINAPSGYGANPEENPLQKSRSCTGGSLSGWRYASKFFGWRAQRRPRNEGGRDSGLLLPCQRAVQEGIMPALTSSEPTMPTTFVCFLLLALITSVIVLLGLLAGVQPSRIFSSGPTVEPFGPQPLSGTTPVFVRSSKAPCTALGVARLVGSVTSRPPSQVIGPASCP